MEFYADASSLLIAIFYVLIAIFRFINNFYADYSLGKKLFYFKEIKNNHFVVFQKFDKIKKLIDLTEPPLLYENNPDNNNSPISSEQLIKMKNNSISTKESQCLKSLEKEEIHIYNKKKTKKN